MIWICGFDAVDDRSHQLAVARLLTVEITCAVVVISVLPDDVWNIFVSIAQKGSIRLTFGNAIGSKNRQPATTSSAVSSIGSNRDGAETIRSGQINKGIYLCPECWVWCSNIRIDNTINGDRSCKWTRTI